MARCAYRPTCCLQTSNDEVWANAQFPHSVGTARAQEPNSREVERLLMHPAYSATTAAATSVLRVGVLFLGFQSREKTKQAYMHIFNLGRKE